MRRVGSSDTYPTVRVLRAFIVVPEAQARDVDRVGELDPQPVVLALRVGDEPHVLVVHRDVHSVHQSAVENTHLWLGTGHQLWGGEGGGATKRGGGGASEVLPLPKKERVCVCVLSFSHPEGGGGTEGFG